MEFMFVPKWLKALLSLTTFFSDCEVHTDESKNECNMLCCNCGKALCSNCVKSCHEGHRLVQIRKSSYHNVVRVQDIQNDFNIKDIQTYVINSFSVVFLHKRICENKRTGKCSKHTSFCRTCRKSIMESFRYCSLGCKFACPNDDESSEWSESSEESESSGSSESSSVLSTNNKVNGKRKMKALAEITKALDEDKDECENTNSNSRDIKATSNSARRKGIPCRAPLM